MFTATLYIMVKNWKQPKSMFINSKKNKQIYIHTTNTSHQYKEQSSAMQNDITYESQKHTELKSQMQNCR